ncbi:leucine--tRNA ligase, partial [Candidatus Aerophobetes bacterium]
AKRETDTMPQWAGSSWYFLRYPDAHLEEASFEKETANYWLPVDTYVGGIEHAILHLLYSRFFTKVLYDLGYIGFDEPFQQLFNQGMVCKRSKRTGRVEKMSKSKGNVVNPDKLIEKYGIDTVRMYELFIGPAELDCEWQDQGIEGIFRFLKKTWNLISKWERESAQEDRETQRRLHLLIRDVTERIEAFKFNTAVSSFMEFINFLNRPEIPTSGVDKKTIETFLVLLAPFAPHLSEELWERLDHSQSIFKESWPLYDLSLVEDILVKIPVQVNGRLRGTLLLARDTPQKEALEEAKRIDKIRKYLEGEEIKKTVFVPGKIINFVTTKG